jgi:hypothetical protein
MRSAAAFLAILVLTAVSCDRTPNVGLGDERQQADMQRQRSRLLDRICDNPSLCAAHVVVEQYATDNSHPASEWYELTVPAEWQDELINHFRERASDAHWSFSSLGQSVFQGSDNAANAPQWWHPLELDDIAIWQAAESSGMGPRGYASVLCSKKTRAVYVYIQRL